LIVDENAAARVNLSRSLITIGADPKNITVTSNYDAGEEELKKERPQIVICDYDLGKRCGLELLQEHRVHYPESKEALFLLVTSNTSQAAVARAAEEDVDAYILKPYTNENLRMMIMRTANSKINLSNYHQVLERGKSALFGGKFKDAISLFLEAMTLDARPALACFYHGQAHLMRQMLDQSHDSYQSGLTYNKIHYKCLVGLFEVLRKQNKLNDAYEVIKKISRYFPANPKRLAMVLHLAIATRHYDDIERYYQIFSELETRNDELNKYISSALVVCGKFYLGNAQARALELFKRASSASYGKTIVLREIIIGLIDHGMNKEAKDYLKKFLPETYTSKDFLACELLVMDKSISPSMTIDKGRKLIQAGIFDPIVYKVLIARSAEFKLDSAAESLAHEAIQRWPEYKNDFEKVLTAAKTDKQVTS